MQELLDRSSNQLSVRGEASSTFLSVDGFGGGNADIGVGGHQNRVPWAARIMPEDVARALGMLHPLYRSSSIMKKIWHLGWEECSNRQQTCNENK